MKGTGYYNEQILTDQRLFEVMKVIQKRMKAGEKMAKGRRGQGICLRSLLEQYGCSANWTMFLTEFDFSKPLTEGRVSKERHAWQVRKAVRWALAHPEQAQKKYGKPGKEEKREEKAEAPAVVDVRLEDFDFLSGMSGIRLRWQVRTPRGRESAFTTHGFEPQIYERETHRDCRGAIYECRTRLAGSFKEGKLTASERRRIVEEGRAQIARALPGRTLESQADTMERLRYLFR